MAEHYVRPALLPREGASPGWALWRYRLVALALLVLLVLAVVEVFLAFSGSTSEDPGIGLPVLTTVAAR